MNPKQPKALAQECADYATSLRSTINVVKLEGREPPISFLRAAELFARAAARIAALDALRTGYDAAQMDIASLRAINLELERVCEATYVAQGADAYHHACSLMERHQKERAVAGKVVGTERSLCDGLSWLYGHIAGLESQLEAERLEIAELQAQLEAIGAGGVEPLRKREKSEPVAWVRKIVLEMRAMDDAQGDLLRRSERVRMKRPADESEYVALYAAKPSMECLHQISEPQAQPVAWAIFAENGNCRMWTQNKSHAEVAAKDTGLPLTALYAAPQPAAQALAALKQVCAIAVSAAKTNSRDIADWREDMDRIAAIAAQQGGQ